MKTSLPYTEFFAHSPPKDEPDRWHSLIDHLNSVAQLSERNSGKFGAADLGHVAGLCHDIGKANPEFQDYLQRCWEATRAGKDAPKRKTPHSLYGALQTCNCDLELLSPILAGHHAGLSDLCALKPRILNPTNEQQCALKQMSEILHKLPTDSVRKAKLPKWASSALSCEFLIRMLFSALVDADRFNTESHFEPGKAIMRGSRTSLGELLSLFEADQNRLLQAAAGTDSPVNQMRKEIYETCLRAADGLQGVYKLTVPTGGGKTRSGMAFALKHAIQHGLDRVIFAIPYTSIIDQTAEIYRTIFGDTNVLEHHSAIEMLDDPDESQCETELRRQLASENWDMPVIVTTTVQLFESLFANKPSRCRKLHNIARSVLIRWSRASSPGMKANKREPGDYMFAHSSHIYLAHSHNKRGRKHPLADHLKDVAEKAACFADSFDAAEEASLAGLLHDLGKYGDLFQERLRGRIHGVDHWSMGAWLALKEYRSIAAAAAIQGHHLGLKGINLDDLRCLDPAKLAKNHPLNLRLSDVDQDRLISRMDADGIKVAPAAVSYPGIKDTVSAMLDVRMLFSVLVDADFLSTEEHFKEGIPGWRRPTAPELNPSAALNYLLAHINRVRSESNSAESVNELRDDLLNLCLVAAGRKPGVWTLSAPTGAGKTLAMLAFALKHAQENGLRRIICVIPYLTIIEQTAEVYGEVFGSKFGEYYLLEHHSLTDVKERPPASSGDNDSEEERRLGRLLLAQNWDAPIILTTSVQMLESLFANRVSPCRKLHRLAKSIILFDEVQTLPQNVAVATLAALSHLVEKYGSSVVFSTATQPAFTALSKHVAKMKDSGNGWEPTEIAVPSLDLFNRARRTKVVWPEADRRVTWAEVADMMAGHGQALCIVNLKRHAHALMEELKVSDVKGLKHLSTSMCPTHRTAVLDEVRRSLKDGEPCVLVATQCVEAGVDLDFPVVFRALGPLDSIAQAAGRCNRSGISSELGNVHIFIPEDEKYPKGGGYEQAAAVTRSLLKDLGPEGMDIHNTDLFRRYYSDLYSITKAWDVGKAAELREAILEQDFEEVAKLYRLIKEDTVSLLVPYEAEQERYDALCAEVRETGMTGDWIRHARELTISIFRPKEDTPILQRMERIRVGRDDFADDWFIYVPAFGENDYKEEVGFDPPKADALWIT